MTDEKRYSSPDIDVTFNGRRCIHTANCLRGSPAVFNSQRRPWITPDQASADEISAVIHTCPSGALHYQRMDGGPQEQPDAHNSISVQADGPHFVRGRIHITNPDGRIDIRDIRLALCRCGSSKNKPYCDNTHLSSGFSDPGDVAERKSEDIPMDVASSLEILADTNGPLRLTGIISIYDSSGRLRFRGQRATLCRCGGSSSKPFCDGTHRTNGFSTE
jgi:CDGSH-type Zn-finger protein/uncharacterized Fe-S cluster protein YjdI